MLSKIIITGLVAMNAAWGMLQNEQNLREVASSSSGMSTTASSSTYMSREEILKMRNMNHIHHAMKEIGYIAMEDVLDAESPMKGLVVGVKKQHVHHIRENIRKNPMELNIDWVPLPDHHLICWKSRTLPTFSLFIERPTLQSQIAAAILGMGKIG